MLERTVASVVPENSECRLLKKISKASRANHKDESVNLKAEFSLQLS